MTSTHIIEPAQPAPTEPDIIYYRPIDPHEAGTVSHLAASVFSEIVAASFEPEGVAEFLQFLSHSHLSARLHQGSHVITAKQGGRLLGMIEVREAEHISLLFVAVDQQGRGIGQKLIELALRHCQSHQPDLRQVTVSATLNAVGFYERMGFHATGAVQLERGMRFVPMAIDL